MNGKFAVFSKSFSFYGILGESFEKSRNAHSNAFLAFSLNQMEKIETCTCPNISSEFLSFFKVIYIFAENMAIIWEKWNYAFVSGPEQEPPQSSEFIKNVLEKSMNPAIF